MTDGEQALLIAYLVDAGELYPDGDGEAKSPDWYQARRPGGVRRDPLQSGPPGGAGKEDQPRGQPKVGLAKALQ